MATHAPCTEENNQSQPVWSNQVYVTHINKGLGHTTTVQGEYGNVVSVLIIKSSKVDLQFLKRITLINKLFSEYHPYIYKINTGRTRYGVPDYLRCICNDHKLETRLDCCKFPYICSNMPESPAYDVYILQLIRYARAYSSCGD